MERLIIESKYEFTENYNEELTQYIDALFTKDKADKMPRQTRLDASDNLIEAYVKHTGERPPSAQLGRLATLILRDELADDTPWKTRNTEYPIESPRQEQDYYNGLSLRSVPETVGTDDVDHRLPTRKYY